MMGDVSASVGGTCASPDVNTAMKDVDKETVSVRPGDVSTSVGEMGASPDVNTAMEGVDKETVSVRQ
jgi:hypothetical protein